MLPSSRLMPLDKNLIYRGRAPINQAILPLDYKIKWKIQINIHFFYKALGLPNLAEERPTVKRDVTKLC